jgi:hypothetical protein
MKRVTDIFWIPQDEQKEMQFAEVAHSHRPIEIASSRRKTMGKESTACLPDAQADQARVDIINERATRVGHSASSLFILAGSAWV